jgi:hypothetical protein
MPLLRICQWLQQTSVSVSIRESIWVFPILDALHCTGIILVAGTIVIVDLRLLGLGVRKQPVSSIIAQVLPWTLFGFAFMVLTGSLLAWAEPLKLYRSVFFRWKLLFLAIAGLNALLFHYGIYRGAARWPIRWDDDATLTPARARLAGARSIACWICVIAAGRAIGYELSR